ncbi:hypothetical protein [Bergeyella sp. RCAD1439]|uniref:hypothetical protein n=1 Tax=Bergeyella anatis TaxID=3113737 RepID=UPI002E19874E|nr:hypothetical protein [Bergeyella sp. RCAD1439]
MDYASEDNFEIGNPINIVYNSDIDGYVATSSFWCKAACTAAALAMIAADGPSPVMDAIAVAYQIACVANCDSK